MTEALQVARTRTMEALEQARHANEIHDERLAVLKAHHFQVQDPEGFLRLPVNERITHVVCRRAYMPPVPWHVCQNCDFHRWTVYDTVKRPVVTCCVNGRDQQARTLDNSGVS